MPAAAGRLLREIFMEQRPRAREVIMERTTTIIPQADVDRQLGYCEQIAALTAQWEEQPLAFWQNLVAAVKGEEAPIVKHNELLRQMKVIDTAFACGKTNSSMKTMIIDSLVKCI